MNQKVHFITFGGPTQNYHRAVNRICNEAKIFNMFDSIVGKTDADLKSDTDFWNKHGKFIESNKRGYGYWLWKSYIVLNHLKTINEGEILLYCDSGCTFNIHGITRMREYISMLNNSNLDVVSFQTEHIEHKLTKNDVFVKLNTPEHDKLTGMYIATSFLLKKSEKTIRMIEEWYNLASQYNLINDTPSITPNHTTFVEHRHDQSILSLIFKKYGTITLTDETYFENWMVDGIKFPIWATRHRNGY
jgi:hypothetical protein